MHAHAALTVAPAVRSLRTRYRQEMNCQIVKDSIHTRPGWAMTYALGLEDTLVGFGTVAVGGPWTGKPTILEFYVLPDHRGRAFDLFEAFVDASGARQMEIQSSDALLAVMLHTYAHETTSEAIVFRDGVTTTLPANGAVVQPLTSERRSARPLPSGRAAPSSCYKWTEHRWVRAAFFFTTTAHMAMSTWRSRSRSAAAAWVRISFRS